MAIHSIRELYPEAVSWEPLSLALVDSINDIIIRIYDIRTRDGAHFVEAIITDKHGKLESKRIIDFN